MVSVHLVALQRHVMRLLGHGDLGIVKKWYLIMERRAYCLKKCDKEDPGNYRGITLLSIVEVKYSMISWYSV